MFMLAATPQIYEAFSGKLNLKWFSIMTNISAKGSCQIKKRKLFVTPKPIFL